MQHSKIIDLWGSQAAFAADLEVDYGMVRKWRQRDRIPPEYWLTVVERARKTARRQVTLEALAKGVGSETQ